jgi:hypothetical protein
MMTEMAPHHDLVHHWCYTRASSAGHGVPFRPGAQYGQRTPLTGNVRGLDSTVPVCPMLLVMCAPRYGLSWPRVTSRHACSLSDVRSMVPGSRRHTRSGWRQRGRPAGAALPSEARCASRDRARRSPPSGGRAGRSPHPRAG